MPRHLTVVTNSETDAFLSCRKKWGFAYVERLHPIVRARALTFGVAFHAGLRTLYAAIGTTDPSPIDAALVAIALEFDRWRASLVTGKNWFSAEDEDRMIGESEEDRDIARWAIRHYYDVFAGDFERFVPVAIEMPVAFALRGRVGQILPHLQYEGVIDLVVFDPEYGDLIVIDHKSTGGSLDALDRKQELDTQLPGYLVGLREILATNRSALEGELIRHPNAPRFAEAWAALQRSVVPTGRLSYNMIRRKRPTIPNINQDGTVSVAAIDTTPELYFAALLDQREPEWLSKGRASTKPEQVEAANLRWKNLLGKQNDLLEGLRSKGETYVSRREFWRSDAELEEWRAQTFEKAREMREAERRPEMRYRNPSYCTGAMARPCAYRAICLDDSPELRLGYEVAETKHVEVEEARKEG